ncbi:aldolase/citrate lyase family protein [Marinifilum sp. RC60d5]|uniref:aldolase/citrate lyase family protein n=1 Tax=Marinifilum sp. RC60d5 TaxID=3458414 RepID=UPI0040365B97
MYPKLKVGVAGNFDSKMKGDCKVQIEICNSGGIDLELHSKVKAFYNNSINDLVRKMASYFSVQHALVKIWDNGALEYVLAARIEAAIKQVITSTKDYLLDCISRTDIATDRERFRMSRLYLPGNIPYMMINAGLHKPNGIILDLEDAVALEKKQEARFVVRNALRSQNFYGAERMVRINQGELGMEDLNFIVPHSVQLILIPKCESQKELVKIDAKIRQLKEDNNISNDIFLMPIIESALGVENAFDIAKASSNIVAMAIGLEDFTADIGVQRTYTGDESLYARIRIVNACNAANIQAIDSVFSDVEDMVALAKNVKVSKALGFKGMGCIHPRQIKVIHENFAPNNNEICKAMKIVNAYYKAQKKGLSIVSLGSKMIDPPVVKRQLKILELAIRLGIAPKNWRETYDSKND